MKRARGSHAKIPYAKLPPTNAKNADLLEYFNEHVQDPHPTSIELQGFVINGERTLEQVHCACPSAAADATAANSLTAAVHSITAATATTTTRTTIVIILITGGDCCYLRLLIKYLILSIRYLLCTALIEAACQKKY